MIEQSPLLTARSGMREPLPAAAAVRVAMKTVGGWLAATIFLLTVSGALPAAINKICRNNNRSVRVTCQLVPVRVDRRVDVIEPDRAHGLTAEQIREDEEFASAEAAAIAAAADQHHAQSRHNLPYRAAPFLARADVLRPGEHHRPLPYAPSDVSAGLQPASYFPPHYNRPPPSAC